jgi:hypothetical protein
LATPSMKEFSSDSTGMRKLVWLLALAELVGRRFGGKSENSTTNASSDRIVKRPHGAESRRDQSARPCRVSVGTCRSPLTECKPTECPATVPPNFRNAHIAARRRALGEQQVMVGCAGSPPSRDGPVWRKLTLGLCGAIEHSRRVIAGQTASGDRQVSNRDGLL